MKATLRIGLCLTMALLPLASCKKYLDKTQRSDITEKDVFRNFTNFQGYVETMYDDVVEWIHLQPIYGEGNLGGDDIVPTRYRGFNEGDYFYLLGNGTSPYYNTLATRSAGTWNGNAAVRNHGIWQNSWFGIRAANITLAHLKDLVDATDEERRLIEGQAYYFRGYFHWELMKAWGRVPFVDTVFAADSDMRIPQKGLYETAELVLKDLQRAADLLPVDWEQTSVGQTTAGRNMGRATKGMAMAYMAECLLYCGSPLFNGVSTGSYTYNKDYCKRAADAAWEVIKLGNQGVYALEPWATYSDIFWKRDGTLPRSREIIFKAPQRGNCRYFSATLGSDPFYSAPSQNYTELFEMANGLPIDDGASGYNAMDPWKNRDPRFRYNFLLDGDKQIDRLTDDRAYIQFYVGGRERTSTTSLTGYGTRKYWHITINATDNGWSNYIYEIPKLRLGEMYLIYAEAANEAYGPSAAAPGATLTAVEAVNVIRNRAGMPNVNAKFTGSATAFRERIWNERAVELAYESKRWYDIRRWYVAHLPKYRELYALEFDKQHTYFKRTLIRTIQFSEKHYWLPFPVNQVNQYPGWKQNPGW
ncbi:RagB/SusD family nutrient uptake outer membrane protein [Chitinophaga lutea]